MSALPSPRELPTSSGSLRLALVLTPLGRNSSSLPNFYWTPLFDALTSAGIHLAVYQPRRMAIWPLRFTRDRSAAKLSVVAPLFVRSLRRFRPTVILSTEYGPHTLIALLTARLIKANGLIFKEHHDCAGISRGRLLYRRFLTRLASGTVVNTDAARIDVETMLGANPIRVHPVTLLAPPMVSDLTRSDLCIHDFGPRPRFLFVGRLVKAKNANVLLEASRILKEEGMTFSVCIAGDGPDSHELSGRALELGLGKQVAFLGSIRYDAIGHVYASCDVLVMPTLRDYRSVTVLEAMRFAMPIIDSRHDGNACDSVLDGVNGFVFDPTDAVSLAAAMRQFIEQPFLVTEMGNRSASFIADQTPAQAAKVVRELLIELGRPKDAKIRHTRPRGERHTDTKGSGSR